MTQRIEPGALAPVLRQASFSGRPEGARLFAEYVLTLLPAGDDRRVLDLGTGRGDVAIRLHKAWPLARFTGLDFSPDNIAAARLRTAGSGIALGCADYLDWHGGPFDMIVADSVLHLIDAPVARLAAKLAGDVVAGGLVVATVPDSAMLNRVHLLLRQFWRRMPAAADGLALTLASLVNSSGLSRQALADRLPYLRLLPHLYGPAEQRIFAIAGLTLERNEPWPSPSLAKPRHRLMVWRRSA
jgi:trans-aconitate methyltransferase